MARGLLSFGYNGTLSGWKYGPIGDGGVVTAMYLGNAGISDGAVARVDTSSGYAWDIPTASFKNVFNRQSLGYGSTDSVGFIGVYELVQAPSNASTLLAMFGQRNANGSQPYGLDILTSTDKGLSWTTTLQCTFTAGSFTPWAAGTDLANTV